MHSQPKKSLGQNFLTDQNIQRKIIDSLQLAPSDIVLEIGSGRGELTGLIAEKAAKVYAVELDRSLCAFLRANFKDLPKVKIIHRDILKFDLNRNFPGLKKKIKVAGNIPYYISSPIITHLFKFRKKISVVFLTVQKEFALRMAARPGSKVYGSFSCFLQYYAKPKILFTIKKTSFRPVPKVDSCFMRMDMKEELPLSAKNEKLLFKVIRSAFGQRRKTLRNSLQGVIPQEKLADFFEKYRIDFNTRPEKLALSDFINLAKK